MTKQQLAILEAEAKAYSQEIDKLIGHEKHRRIKTAAYYGYLEAAKKYNADPQAAEERIKELEQWQREALLVMNHILDYGQSHPDIKLGQSITSFVIERCKQYDELKAEHAALKERVQGLVDALDALDEIIDMSNAGKTLSHIDSHVAQRARTALQSWNQGKGGGV